MARQEQIQPGFSSHARRQHEQRDEPNFVEPKSLDTPAADSSPDVLHDIDASLAANEVAPDSANSDTTPVGNMAQTNPAPSEPIRNIAAQKSNDGASQTPQNQPELPKNRLPENSQPATTPRVGTGQPTATAQASKATPGGNRPWYVQRKNQVRVGIAIVTIIISIIGYILYIPFEIIHIAQVLWHHHGDRQQSSEDRAERKVWERLFTNKQTAELGGYKFQTGHIILDKFHNTNLHKLDARLRSSGVEPVYAADNQTLVGIKDAQTGELIKDFQDKNILERNALTLRTIQDHLGTKNPILLAYFTKLARTQWGVSFTFWSKNAAKTTSLDLLKKLWSKVGEGAAGDPELNATSNEQDQNKKAAEQQALNNSGASDVNGAAQAANTEFSQSFDMKKAIAAGKAFLDKKSVKGVGTVTAILSFYCMLRSSVGQDITQRVFTLTDRLIRTGDMVQTQAHQAEAGDLHSDEYFLMLQRYAGDDNADPNTSEDAKDFTKAASWKRAVGDPVSTDQKNYANYNPDLNPAANPSPAAISTGLKTLEEFFNVPGLSSLCTVLNSWFGWVIQGVSLIATIFTGPVGIAVAAAQSAAIAFANATFVPWVLEAVTNLGVTGTENPVGLINNASAGTALNMAAFGKNRGDIPLGPQALAAANEDAATDQSQIAQSRGWTYRLFAIDNSNSITSRMLDKIPLTPGSAVASISGSLQHFVPNLATIFGSVALGDHRALAAAPAGQCEFGFACFGTSFSTIDQYGDPHANEDVLAAPITKKDGTVTSRLEMLGDPSTYKPTDADLPHTGLLYCFVNKYTPPSGPGQPTDPICKDLTVITPADPNKTTYDLPGPNEILNTIYCQQNNVCGLPYEDDFNRYRMEIKYYLHATAIYGYTIDGDPWAQ